MLISGQMPTTMKAISASQRSARDQRFDPPSAVLGERSGARWAMSVCGSGHVGSDPVVSSGSTVSMEPAEQLVVVVGLVVLVMSTMPMPASG